MSSYWRRNFGGPAPAGLASATLGLPKVDELGPSAIGTAAGLIGDVCSESLVRASALSSAPPGRHRGRSATPARAPARSSAYAKDRPAAPGSRLLPRPRSARRRA